MKNRELFERTFPELKARREQLERFTRSVQDTSGSSTCNHSLDQYRTPLVVQV